jgi:hypothetical protein
MGAPEQMHSDRQAGSPDSDPTLFRSMARGGSDERNLTSVAPVYSRFRSAGRGGPSRRLEGAKNRRSENSECHDWGAAKRVSNCDDRRDERNGSMKVLRKGSNDWTCVPDDPSSPGNDPMCLDPNAMEWLHAYVGKKPPPDKIGFIYMLQGGWDFSNLDPYATKPDGKATITGPHVMIVGPGVKAVPGYDRTGNGVNPAISYVMWKDTAYEHLMIPVR